MMDRHKWLAACDALLAGKPQLAAIFDEAWCRDFHARVDALPEGDWPAFPFAYLLPMKCEIWPHLYPTDLQGRLDRAIGALIDQMPDRDKKELRARLRSEKDSAACEELMAAAAFSAEFGVSALKCPTTTPDLQRPEFFVECPSARWAVECRRLEDNVIVKGLNATMIQTGQPWIARIDHDLDPTRMRNAISAKLRKRQGSGPMVLLLSSHSPWLMPDEMQAVVRDIFLNPQGAGVPSSHLPVALGCFTLTIAQGIWLCEGACMAAGIDAALAERIRAAIAKGYVPRGDGGILTERDWSSPS